MADLTIDTEVHNKDSEIHSSLEFINGYHVFSTEFSDALNIFKEQETEQINNSINKVFKYEIVDTTYDNYLAVMNSEQTFIIRNEYVYEESNGNIGDFIFFAVGIAFAAAFFIFTRILKKKKETKRHENNDYVSVG